MVKKSLVRRIVTIVVAFVRELPLLIAIAVVAVVAVAVIIFTRRTTRKNWENSCSGGNWCYTRCAMASCDGHRTIIWTIPFRLLFRWW